MFRRKSLAIPVAASAVVAASALVAASLLGPPGAPSARAGQAVWGPPTAISGPLNHPADLHPDVAVDPAGNTTAVWAHGGDEGVGRVRAAWRPAGGGWRTPTTIGSGCSAQVGADARGNLTVVSQCGPGGRIMVARRPMGGGWCDPVALSEPEAHHGYVVARHPRLAVSSGGAAVVSWVYGAEDSWPGRAEVVYRPAGGRWSRPHVLTRRTIDPAAVAIDARGNVTTAFMDARGRVKAARRVVGRGWLPPVRISADRRQGTFYLPVQVAVDARGDATAAWGVSGGALKAASRRLSHRWSAPVPLRAAGDLDWRLGMDDAGTALIVSVGGQGAIHVRSKPPRGPWGQPKTIVPADGSDRGPAEVDFDPRGDALLSWSESNGKGTTSSRASYRPRGGTWGISQRLADAYPAIALYRNGNAVAVGISTDSWRKETMWVWAQVMRAPS